MTVWEEEGKPRFSSQDYLTEGLNNFTGKKYVGGGNEPYPSEASVATYL